MADLMADVSSFMNATSRIGSQNVTSRPKREPSASLDMTDFLNLMVTELANQSIDSQANTSDMLNQLVQMQMIEAITNMTDASVMSYAASLVGKEVTVAEFNSDGTLKEVVGTVTGTGTLNGEQVIFVGDKYYHLSEIMAVGRLPEVEKPDTKPDEGDGTKPVDPDGTEKPDKPVGPEQPDNKPTEPDKNEGTQPSQPDSGSTEQKNPVDVDKPAQTTDEDRPQQTEQTPLVPGAQEDQSAGNAPN